MNVPDNLSHGNFAPPGLHPENIPDILKAKNRWVLWKKEKRDGKWTKVPYQANGDKASHSNEATWTTFEAAVAALQKPDSGFWGVGFVVSNVDNIIGWDLDHCLNPKSLEPAPWAAKLVADLNSYTEITPSGTGLRIIVLAELPRAGGKNSGVGVECYGSLRYLTLTGQIWPGAPRTVEERSAETLAAFKQYFESEGGVEAEIKPFRRNDRFNLLWSGEWQSLNFESQSEADFDLCLYLARMTGGNEVVMDNLFRASGLMRPKWDSRRDKGTYGQTTIERAIARSRKQTFEHTDRGNGLRFAEVNSHLARYCKLWDTWLIWDGTRWKRDLTDAVTNLADATIEHIRQEARAATEKNEAKETWRWVKRSQSRGSISAMIYLGGTGEAEGSKGDGISSLAAVPCDFDQDAHLFNVLNGTLDLQTGVLQRPRQSDMITLRSDVPYDPAATCPRWLRFLSEITRDDRALIDYLQTAVGYSLTGKTTEQCFFFLYGGGQNGKSTFIERVMKVAGEYGRTSQAEVLEDASGQQHPTAIASLDGARFVVMAETEGSKKIRESRLKQLTGGDQVTARKMRQDEFTFVPKLKLWMHGNHKLPIHGTDVATWRRPHMIPFTVPIPDEQKDPLLGETLDRELPGILAWAVAGAKLWFTRGLRPPETVLAATREYRIEQDVLAEFVAENLDEDVGAKNWEPHARVYKRYVAWAEAEGMRPMSSSMLSRRLEERGFERKRGVGNAKGWTSFRLVPRPDSEDTGADRGGDRQPDLEEM